MPLTGAAAVDLLVRRVQPVGMYTLPHQRAEDLSAFCRQRRRQQRILFAGAQRICTTADAIEAFGRLVPRPEVLVADRPGIGKRAATLSRVRRAASKINREQTLQDCSIQG